MLTVSCFTCSASIIACCCRFLLSSNRADCCVSVIFCNTCSKCSCCCCCNCCRCWCSSSSSCCCCRACCCACSSLNCVSCKLTSLRLNSTTSSNIRFNVNKPANRS